MRYGSENCGDDGLVELGFRGRTNEERLAEPPPSADPVADTITQWLLTPICVPVRVVRCSSFGAREPATGVASQSHRGGTAWPILTAEARCWILTRTLR
jgi:hypothetical protein